MKNCPSCKHEFKGIEDFQRVKVLKVEIGNLEELVGNISRTSESTNSLVKLFEFDDDMKTTEQPISPERWKILQKVESLFSNPRNINTDGLGKYVTVGNNFDHFFDDLIEHLARVLPSIGPQKQEEVTEIIAKFREFKEDREGKEGREFREGRLYREPIIEKSEPTYNIYVPPNPGVLPQPLQIQSDSLLLRQIGWQYFYATSPDKSMANVTAYVSKLESFAGKVVEPEELLKAEFAHDLAFKEIKYFVHGVGRDGKPVEFPGGHRHHKTPRETGIHLTQYGGARFGRAPSGKPIATITYEGMLAEQTENKAA